MLLTITTTHQPATDLGYLLHKNPSRLHSFELSFGEAHVFYPEASAERCTAALLLDVDPVGLVRNRKGPSGEARDIGPVCKRSAVCRVVVFECGDLTRARKCAGRAEQRKTRACGYAYPFAARSRYFRAEVVNVYCAACLSRWDTALLLERHALDPSNFPSGERACITTWN